MKWFERMTVLQSLLLAFAIVIAFCAVVGGTGLMTLSSMHDLTDTISSRHMDGLYWMEEANRNKIDADLAAANLGYAEDEAGRQRLDAGIVASLKNMHDAYDRYRLTISTPKGEALFDEVLRKSAVWEEIVHQQIGQEPIPAGVDNTIINSLFENAFFVESFTVVLDLDNNVSGLVKGSKFDSPGWALPRLSTILGRFNTVINRISHHMYKRVGDFIDYASVEFSFFA